MWSKTTEEMKTQQEPKFKNTTQATKLLNVKQRHDVAVQNKSVEVVNYINNKCYDVNAWSQC